MKGGPDPEGLEDLKSKTVIPLGDDIRNTGLAELG